MLYRAIIDSIRAALNAKSGYIHSFENSKSEKREMRHNFIIFRNERLSLQKRREVQHVASRVGWKWNKRAYRMTGTLALLL